MYELTCKYIQMISHFELISWNMVNFPLFEHFMSL